jgi:Ca2+-binding EF-hand superfamily protein
MSDSDDEEEEVEENLTESDEEHEIANESQLKQIKSIRQFKYGITKSSFVSLMKSFHENYQNAAEKTIIDFQPERYEQIFEMFDDTHCGSLDFREFLTCFSVLLRGTFSKKLELFFTAFGSK